MAFSVDTDIQHTSISFMLADDGQQLLRASDTCVTGKSARDLQQQQLQRKHAQARLSSEHMAAVSLRESRF